MSLARPSPPPGRPEPRRYTASHRTQWVVAIVGTLALHAGAAVGLRAWPLAPIDPTAPVPRDPIRVVFAPRPEPRPAAPPPFTELPADRADAPPERPEALSNVDSRARDRVAGGDDVAPARQLGSLEAPSVAMTPGEPSPPPSPSPPEAFPEPASEPTPPSPEAETPAADGGRPVSLLQEQLRRQAPLRAPVSRLDPSGDSDLPQEASRRPEGNAALTGDISLSTTEWEYAPWLSTFRRAVHPRWQAPPAYYLGMISGWALLELEISRDGELLRTTVLQDEVGHWSLVDAAVYAVEAAAPYRPLPASFPEETLRLRIRFSYPSLRH